ncbi:MAG: nucleotide sugar dehydrogenase [Deltaproteobacteria bacterium]|nr:nucleotide sugar dehydrogenase [Deltaproteobacteria bacterium]NND29539.1 nucleotide sugar dehydrogenase [Myxococcales bacterium]MBT8464350.1 nucleotide sugar dehydrogenase [Deltaproteobacteria bacterium]MBT8481901.1 nucleotide sugar dehydrogenase [Deltaproteobacteria bacterium]NNK09400.1 nucleotide sugar dehydrogenase [Myxococcales bacterium]
MSERIAVVGLGYVGLPVALAFARKFEDTVGFDVSEARVKALTDHHDWTGEVTPSELEQSRLRLTSDPADLRGCTFFVVAVPTPIDSDRRPDLGPLHSATRIVGSALAPGAVVVYESTVYPGVTEEQCGPLLAESSGLRQSRDFKLGYSPERINPGDKLHTFEKIIKVVAGEDPESLERVARTYEAVVEAGVHRASSIKVAEAAKVIENTQRDVNIALMNELALIFDRLEISTRDVLQAAGTKWNFLGFTPGLVGGHCIGVDPYYLTAKAEALGYHPEVILAGRRINDDMGKFVAQRTVKLLRKQDRVIKGARIGVLGLTFKENVPDLRNSRVPDIIEELREFGIEPVVHDPMASAEEAIREYGIELRPFDAIADLDGLILAVPHRPYLDQVDRIIASVRRGGVVIDVKSVLSADTLQGDQVYWSL